MNTNLAPPILDHLSALGDETRTRILVLLERSEFTVSELCAALQLPQPTVSRHLRTLADDGWVVSRAEGRNRHYRIPSTLAPASRDLWRIVRSGLGDEGLYAADSERARGVLAERRRRSAEFFAASAHHWDQVRHRLFGAGAETLPLYGLLDPDWTVGDLGSGSGDLMRSLAPFVSRVIGVDRSTEMLDTARLRLEDMDNVELRAGELEALPLQNDELDVALLNLVLHYVVDPAQAVSEACRVVRPGGRVVVVDMRVHERGAEYSEAMGHVWPGFDIAQMKSWLEEAGFIRVHTVLLPPDPAADGPLLFMATGFRPDSDIHQVSS